MWDSLGREDFPLQLLNVASDVRQAAEGVYGAQPLSMIKAGDPLIILPGSISP